MTKKQKTKLPKYVVSRAFDKISAKVLEVFFFPAKKLYFLHKNLFCKQRSMKLYYFSFQMKVHAHENRKEELART
jgi:hypothetical protein